jgi:hypothetical protein
MEQLYIIKVRNKWGVYKTHSNRSMKNFKHRDLAFHYAVPHAIKNRLRITVFDADGFTDFVFEDYHQNLN